MYMIAYGYSRLYKILIYKTKFYIYIYEYYEYFEVIHITKVKYFNDTLRLSFLLVLPFSFRKLVDSDLSCEEDEDVSVAGPWNRTVLRGEGLAEQ